MAITFIAETKEFTPAFNQVVFVVDSTNKNKEGFRYVIDVYRAGTTDKVHESRIAPRIGDGYGIISLEKVLQSYVSPTLDLSSVTSVSGFRSFFEFDLKIGEEFVEEWTYQDYEERSGNKTALDSTSAHTFVVGDAIQVRQTDPTIKPQLEGLFIVTEVPNGTEIIIDIDWSDVGTGTATGGKVRYADNRTSITRDLATKTKVVFNGAETFLNFINWNDADYKLTGVSTTNRLVTDLPETGYFTSDSALMFLNFCQAENNTVQRAVFQSDSGATFTKSVVSGGALWMRQFACGAGNMNDAGVIITPETKYYDVWLDNGSGGQCTRKYRITIDRRCTISDFELLFMDRKGSFLPFAYPLRGYKSNEVKKETYMQELGNLVGIGYTYYSYSAGEVVTSVNTRSSWRLTTNWLNEQMSAMHDQLLTSPVVYMKINGVWVRVTVEETGFQTDEIKNKKMIKKTVNIRLANEDNINA